MAVGRPVVVMGISGSGKTTIGRRLADRLGVPFADADDLHSSAAVAKMAAGVPLDDGDRCPWLDRVGDWLAVHETGGVMSCSALRRGYRDRLRQWCGSVVFVYLAVDGDTAESRIRSRTGHYMPATLVSSQIATLEQPTADEHAITLDGHREVPDLVDAAVESLR